MATNATARIPAAVSSIIAAFVSVRDALARSARFTHYKAKGSARKKPDPKGDEKNAKQRLSAGAIRLSRTLGEAPQAIQNEYARGLVSHGQAFAVGDVEAQAALSTVLVKLNSGLVEVISQLLRRSSHSVKAAPDLDFQQIALLCDASRLEACQSLFNLRRRLSTIASPRIRRSLAAPVPKSNEPASTERPAMAKGTKSAANKSPQTRQSNQVQFAFVRTRPHSGRKNSSTSSTGSSTLVESPSSPRSTSPPCKSKVGTRVGDQHSKSRVTSNIVNKAKPKASKNLSGLAITYEKPSKTSLHQAPERQSAPDKHLASQNTGLESPSIPGLLPQQQARHLSRAQTIKSIASGSTRIGEIPMHKWPIEHDWDQMNLLNSQAAAAVGTVANMDGGARRGLLARIFRKSAATNV